MCIVFVLLFWCAGHVIVAGVYLQKYVDDYCNLETGERGICVNIHECPYAESLLKEKRQPNICTFEGSTPIVCCNENNVRSSLTAIEPGTLSAMKCKEYYPFKRNFLLIGGATPSLVQEFPHMAIIGFGEENNIQWACGGTLISTNFVLTAAHCLTSRDLGDAKWVRLGDLDIATDTDQAEPQQFSIKRRIPHPDYKRPARYHDIAVVELDRDIKRTQFVDMACLDTNRQQEESSLIATGWGRTEFSGQYSSLLLKSDFDIVPFDSCRPHYERLKTELPNGILDEYQICAGGGPIKDTCQGDSGGPLQVKNLDKFSSLKVYNIVAITSFGKACGLTNSPGVYTRVYSYLSWIENIVWPSS